MFSALHARCRIVLERCSCGLCSCSLFMLSSPTRGDRPCFLLTSYDFTEKRQLALQQYQSLHLYMGVMLQIGVCVLVGNCFWVQELDWCIGTNDGPNGERWAFLAAAMFYCVHNTIRSNEQVLGCGPGTCQHSSAVWAAFFVAQWCQSIQQSVDSYFWTRIFNIVVLGAAWPTLQMFCSPA